MRVVVAMNSFKGALGALEACDCVTLALKETGLPLDIEAIPMVDGGTGSLEVWEQLFPHAQKISIDTVNAAHQPCQAAFLLDKASGRAYIEMAQSSGLHLLDPTQLDVLRHTTLGTGRIIHRALEEGAAYIYLGLGGSATHDLGLGILRALGVRFIDRQGQTILTPLGLRQLGHVDTSDLWPVAAQAQFTFLCDVSNPLLGAQGAAATFAPQKGASSSEVTICEEISLGVVNYFAQKGGFGRLGLKNVGQRPGDGAAGGIPALLGAILNTRIVSGATFTAQVAHLESKISTAHLVITGEGSFDAQSLDGKGPGYVVEVANKLKTPVVVLAGALDTGIKHLAPYCTVFSIAMGPAALEEAIAYSQTWLKKAAQQVVKLFDLGYNLDR